MASNFETINGESYENLEEIVDGDIRMDRQTINQCKS
jgi:hypothetical protein